MKTFLAFKFEKEISEQEISKRLNLVKKHFYESVKINFDVIQEKHILDNLGFCIWDDKNSPLKWPNFVENENSIISSYFPPPNWKEFSSTEDLLLAPFELIDNIKRDYTFLNNYSYPFLMAEMDKTHKNLHIYCDAMGFSRLYELRTEEGWFWSNRIGALPLFSNTKAKIDLEAWQIFAGAGWFMGSSTPISNIRRIKPSTIIKVDAKKNKPRVNIDTGGLDQMIGPRNVNDINVEKVAEDIKKSFASFASLWDRPFNVDLSGGKDSRVSAAAIVSAGIQNVTFKTIGNLQSEVDIAKILLDKVDRQDQHNIVLPSNKSNVNKTPIKERVMTLLHEYDGDYTPVVMKQNLNPDKHFNSLKSIVIQGAGGETAKGAYYSNEKWVAKIKDMGEFGPFHRLSNYLLTLGCLQDGIEEKINHQIFNVFEEGKDRGFKDLLLLNYFQFTERFRRWVPLGGNINRYSPFLSPEFIRTAFDLTPEQRVNTTLHKDVIKYLVPEWEEVPYYKATPEQSEEKTKKKLRMWQNEDRYQIEEILNQDELWNDIFNPEEVKELWNQAKQSGIENRRETLFQRVILRALFNDHLERINRNLEEL